MKFSLRAGSILATFALSIAGCDPEEPKVEEPPKHEEHKDSKQGPPSPAPYVDPSATPALPSTLKSERDAAEKASEAKPADKKDEPKHETPK